MPNYTIMGATGNTGGALLNLLLKAPNTNIHAYVRSKAKLLTQNPGLDENARVNIFEGSISDVSLIASALSPIIDVAFCVLAINENTPGIRVAQDTTQSVIAALCHIRTADATAKLPKLIFLSSASLNPTLYEKDPAILHAFISRAFSNVYADLAFAEKDLRLHESWLSATFVQPGALVEDVQKGHALSLDQCSPLISYLDLAAGMIEIAESGKYDWKGVSLVATSKDVKFPYKAPPQILRGLVWHFAPWLYWTCHYLRLV